MALFNILFRRERLILTNTLIFPVMEEENPLDGSQPGRSLALVRIYLPLFFLLDNIQAEVLGGGLGRSGLEDQPSLFRTVEDLVTSHTGAPGHACVLRFICELQHHPLERWSLLGQLISVLFTPEYGDKNQLLDYATSHRLGRRIRDSRNCASHYGECPLSVFRYMEAFGNSTVTT